MILGYLKVALLLHTKRFSRCKNCRIGRLRFDIRIQLQTVFYPGFSKQKLVFGKKDSTTIFILLTAIISGIKSYHSASMSCCSDDLAKLLLYLDF